MSSLKIQRIGAGGTRAYLVFSSNYTQTGMAFFGDVVRTALIDATSYALAVLTNQGSISLKDNPKTLKVDQRSLASFKLKVANVFNHFDFPIFLLAATARDLYRKPRTGMWTELLEDMDRDEGDGPDLQNSFFVGDAAGRTPRNGAKADHACSDRYAS